MEFTIPDNPEFNLNMRQLERTDPAAAELFNTLFLQLLQNDAAIKRIIELLQPSDVGLDKVENKKAVSTETQTLTAEEKEQARANIGAGTSSFSGSYSDLANKPTSMKNPAALTFTGGATVSYDGSAAKTVAIPAAVRVKGNAETSYHTGDVNLTPANIGAVALSGGTMTGQLKVTATGIATSTIHGNAVNLCSGTLEVSPGTTKASGGLYVSAVNGLQYRPVVIGPSAPSDKTALWIDTST